MNQAGFHLSDDMEDRRGEFNDWQQFLMDIGVQPIDHATPMGGTPGNYNAFDLPDPPTNPSVLAQQLGYNEIGKPHSIEDLLTMNQPLEKMRVPDLEPNKPKRGF